MSRLPCEWTRTRSAIITASDAQSTACNRPGNSAAARVLDDCRVGTVLEATMVWQLLRVRHLHDRPLIFIGDMGGDLVDWARRYMLRPGLELASPEDMELPRCVTTAEEVIALIREHQARWQETHGLPT